MTFYFDSLVCIKSTSQKDLERKTSRWYSSQLCHMISTKSLNTVKLTAERLISLFRYFMTHLNISYWLFISWWRSIKDWKWHQQSYLLLDYRFSQSVHANPYKWPFPKYFMTSYNWFIDVHTYVWNITWPTLKSQPNNLCSKWMVTFGNFSAAEINPEIQQFKWNHLTSVCSMHTECDR